jgi:dihydroflavonol-4-reductase
MADSKVALVTGVSGHVAAAMAARLRMDGFRVRGLVRTADQAAAAARRGWEPVRGDLTAPETLRAAVDGVAVVVHAAAYLGLDWSLAETVNVHGTRWLAEVSQQAGVGRFVHISTMSVHGDPQPDGLREESPLATDAAHPYVATKARAELALGEVCSGGLQAAILRPGAICAVMHSQWGDELVSRLRDGGWPSKWHPGDIIPWVHTDDLAEMTWLAATHPKAAGQTFMAVDNNVVVGDFLGPIITALGGTVVLPAREPVLSRCRIGRIREACGYHPRRTFEQTLEELVAVASAGAPARPR